MAAVLIGAATSAWSKLATDSHRVMPTGVDDCADGLNWVVEHIGQHGGHNTSIFVGGHSAGGHYAALLATSKRWAAARGLPDQLLRGCLPLSGVFEFGERAGLPQQVPFSRAPTRTMRATPVRFINWATPCHRF